MMQNPLKLILAEGPIHGWGGKGFMGPMGSLGTFSLGRISRHRRRRHSTFLISVLLLLMNVQ